MASAGLPRRILVFAFFAALALASFVRLGFWQIGRLNARQADNIAQVSLRSAPPRPLHEVLADSGNVRFRSVRLTGRYDYEHQFVLTARGRNGAPGVNFLTPMHPDDGGPVVLINRGWAYSADGMRVNDTLWREAERDTVDGYIELSSPTPGPVTISSIPRGVRRAALDSLQAMLPWPIAPVMVVQQRGAGQMEKIEHPFRAELPALDEGPHRGYALQWFAFAFITLVGTTAVLVRERSQALRGSAGRR